jgi:hypothetical protein
VKMNYLTSVQIRILVGNGLNLMVGQGGGNLVGFNEDKIDVLHILHGDFSLKFKLRNKEDNFEWCFIVVYGAAQDHDKEKFLGELVRMCDSEYTCSGWG